MGRRERERARACEKTSERVTDDEPPKEGSMTMTDPDTALAAIRAAGDDFQSLYEAIKNAAFLDATPGDHRQQLRAAKAKLKKIHLEAKKKAEEVAKKKFVAIYFEMDPKANLYNNNRIK